jgi:hypothetical protein
MIARRFSALAHFPFLCADDVFGRARLAVPEIITRDQQLETKQTRTLYQWNILHRYAGFQWSQVAPTTKRERRPLRAARLQFLQSCLVAKPTRYQPAAQASAASPFHSAQQQGVNEPLLGPRAGMNQRFGCNRIKGPSNAEWLASCSGRLDRAFGTTTARRR